MAQSAHGQHTYYQGGAGDLLCELKVRNDQVYLGGCTNSYSFFPFAFTPPAYFSGLPPDPTIENGPNVWNGFIANISDLLNFDVGITSEVEVDEPIVVFPSPATDQLNIRFGPEWKGPVNLDVFEATGRLLLRKVDVKIAADVVPIDINTLAPGVYHGLVSGKSIGHFNFTKR